MQSKWAYCERVSGKLTGRTSGANGFCQNRNAPIIDIIVDGEKKRGLVDTGSTRTIISGSRGDEGELVNVVGGQKIQCSQKVASLVLFDVSFTISCLIVEKLVPGIDVLIGMDIINMFGGVKIQGQKIEFLDLKSCSYASITKLPISQKMIIDDQDFMAEFYNGRWEVSWKMMAECAESMARSVDNYKIDANIQEAYEEEINSWISKGWLVPYCGEVKAKLPLMAIVQENKMKVRPVIDYRKINELVSSHSAEADVCGEKLRLWRTFGNNLAMVDLRSAYLQIHVSPNLWKYQIVRFQGKTFALTRLGFGLNVAPKIMSTILKTVLSKKETIRCATDSYIDDIVVNLDKITVKEVVDHLESFGLKTKEPEFLGKCRVLGLRTFVNDGSIYWKRDNLIPELLENMTKRQLFSWTGKILGHLPVARELRPKCAFLKRMASKGKWDDQVLTEVIALAKELKDGLKTYDPAKGLWAIDISEKLNLWCDASTLAIGVVLETKNGVIEDACWLRKLNDSSHINVAELEGVIRGISVAVRWKFKNINIKTDSRVVFGWLKSTIEGTTKVKTKALSDALIRRRLDIIKQMCHELQVNISVDWIPSRLNKADILTRVPQKWMAIASPSCLGLATKINDVSTIELIRKVHNRHHFGTEKTLHAVRSVEPWITKDEVKEFIKSCEVCKSIDPDPVKWEKGKLDVKETWYRLAADVTHYSGDLFLTVIDCSEGRFTIWTKLMNESANEISKHLKRIFCERGSPVELLVDNSKTFHSAELLSVCQYFGVKLMFRAAYRPSGNGIIERVHRTIKRTAARARISIEMAVFHYNALPRCDNHIIPADSIYRYSWRLLDKKEEESEKCSTIESIYKVGDRVYVKPDNIKCWKKWPIGTITGIISSTVVQVNGVNRHIADIRLSTGFVRSSKFNELDVTTDESETDSEIDEIQGCDETKRSDRVKRRPGWWFDYDVDI